MNYSDIIKRLEEADGPDRELDAHIYVACGDADEGASGFGPYLWRRLVLAKAGYYTTSLDEAIAVVERMLPGWEWATGFDGKAYGAAVSCTGDFDFEAHAKTAPIAIMLAVFQALETKDRAA